MRSVIVSYLTGISFGERDIKAAATCPSLGSLIDLRLMYSSYSKRPNVVQLGLKPISF